MDYWRNQPERPRFAEGEEVDVAAWWTLPRGGRTHRGRRFVAA